jgi:hypothetical protein
VKKNFFQAKEDKGPKFRRGRNEDEYPKRHNKRKEWDEDC